MPAQGAPCTVVDLIDCSRLDSRAGLALPSVYWGLRPVLLKAVISESWIPDWHHTLSNHESKPKLGYHASSNQLQCRAPPGPASAAPRPNTTDSFVQRQPELNLNRALRLIRLEFSVLYSVFCSTHKFRRTLAQIIYFYRIYNISQCQVQKQLHL